MVDFGLLALSVVSLLTGIAFLNVARVVARRATTPDARRANLTFTVWWAGFGIVEILLAIYMCPSVLEAKDLPLAITLAQLILVASVVALGGLVHFLAYVYTGRGGVGHAVLAAHAVLLVATLYLFAWMSPVGFDPTSRSGALLYENHLRGAAATLVPLLYTAPVLLATAAYTTLYFRTRQREPRLRVALVSVAFLGSFGWTTLSALLDLEARHPDSLLPRTTSTLLALGAALLVTLAYAPPRSLQAWIGVASKSQPS